MASNQKPVFLFDMTRHRSHLFFRYLSTHPGVQSMWHPYLPAFLYGPERMTQYTDDNWTKAGDEGEGVDPNNSYAAMTTKYGAAMQAATEKNQMLVANEHCQMMSKREALLPLIRDQPIPEMSNPTMIPDSVFETLTPIFVIRHPVFAVASNYVAIAQATQIPLNSENWKMMTCMPMQRRLFDLLHKQRGTPPLVIDGDDVVWRTEDVGQAVGKYLNIDPSKFSRTWEKTPEDQRNAYPVIRYFLQAIDDSTGIECPTDSRPDPDVAKAYTTWKEQYGEEVADQLKKTVERNVQHYEHIQKFKTY